MSFLSCVEATEKKNGQEPKRALKNMEGEEGDEKAGGVNMI